MDIAIDFQAATVEVNQVNEGYVNTAEAAKRLGVTQRTIARWVSKGCFPGAIKVNPQFKHSPYLIPIVAIEDFEASREIERKTDESN